MENPWKDISEELPYAPCDKETIFSEKYISRFQINDMALPEPYVGDLNSNVVCLNGNPSEKDDSFQQKNLYLKELQATLNHKSDRFMWLSKELEATGHRGVGWWKQITKSLCEELGSTPRLFVLEYFPYHSKRMYNFPKLPSDAYRDYLLDKALTAGKLIVIMRAKARWFGIKEYNIGERLKEYERQNSDRLIILRNPRRVYLTKNNMGPSNWELFLNTLKKH